LSQPKEQQQSCQRCGRCCQEAYSHDMRIYQNLTQEQVALVRRPRTSGCPLLHGVLCEIDMRFGHEYKSDICKNYYCKGIKDESGTQKKETRT
jgi:hypothetical protein